jgi:hypothetical protein
MSALSQPTVRPAPPAGAGWNASLRWKRRRVAGVWRRSRWRGSKRQRCCTSLPVREPAAARPVQMSSRPRPTSSRGQSVRIRRRRTYHPSTSRTRWRGSPEHSRPALDGRMRLTVRRLEEPPVRRQRRQRLRRDRGPHARDRLRRVVPQHDHRTVPEGHREAAVRLVLRHPEQQRAETHRLGVPAALARSPPPAVDARLAAPFQVIVSRTDTAPPVSPVPP